MNWQYVNRNVTSNYFGLVMLSSEFVSDCSPFSTLPASISMTLASLLLFIFSEFLAEILPPEYMKFWVHKTITILPIVMRIQIDRKKWQGIVFALSI
jgi:hypothetical protein